MAEFLHRVEIVNLGMGLAINKSKTKLLIVDRFVSIQRTVGLVRVCFTLTTATIETFKKFGSLIG